MYLHCNGGAEDQRKAALYITLAHTQDQYHLSTFQLGKCFYSGFGGLSKSLYRAKHYLEEAAEKGVDAAYYCLEVTLGKLCHLQYKGIMEGIPGHSCIPMVLFWARKVVANEMSKADANKMIGELERFAKESCATTARETRNASLKEWNNVHDVKPRGTAEENAS